MARPLHVLAVLGLAVGVVLVVVGVLFAIPAEGAIGVVWTVVALGILIVNAVRYFRGDLRRALWGPSTLGCLAAALSRTGN